MPRRVKHHPNSARSSQRGTSQGKTSAKLWAPTLDRSPQDRPTLDRPSLFFSGPPSQNLPPTKGGGVINQGRREELVNQEGEGKVEQPKGERGRGHQPKAGEEGFIRGREGMGIMTELPAEWRAGVGQIFNLEKKSAQGKPYNNPSGRQPMKINFTRLVAEI